MGFFVEKESRCIFSLFQLEDETIETVETVKTSLLALMTRHNSSVFKTKFLVFYWLFRMRLRLNSAGLKGDNQLNSLLSSIKLLIFIYLQAHLWAVKNFVRYSASLCLRILYSEYLRVRFRLLTAIPGWSRICMGNLRWIVEKVTPF